MHPSYIPVSIVFLIFLFSPVTASASTTIMTKMLRTQEYESKFDAIKALGQEFLAISIKEDVEHMGAILVTPEGKFRVSHGKSTPGKDRFRFSVLRPVSLKVVAYWHTHGANGLHRERFSLADAMTVRKTRLPFYLITPTGEFKVLHLSQTGSRRVIARTITTGFENA